MVYCWPGRPGGGGDSGTLRLLSQARAMLGCSAAMAACIASLGLSAAGCGVAWPSLHAPDAGSAGPELEFVSGALKEVPYGDMLKGVSAE